MTEYCKYSYFGDYCTFKSGPDNCPYSHKDKESEFNAQVDCEFCKWSFNSISEEEDFYRDQTDPHEDDEYYLNESEEDIMDRENQFKELYETDLDSVPEAEGEWRGW